MSSKYKVTRELRQGDPLLCLLFNIAIEPLATMLQNSDLKGFKAQGAAEITIVSLLANDTTIYLSEEDDYGTLQHILNK